MAGITLAQAEAKLSTWMDALDAVATNQSYSIGDRTLTRANLADVQDQVEFWDKKVRELTDGGIKVRLGTPV